MAESGCLRDVQVQNLNVEGTTEFKGTVLGNRRNIITVTGANGSDVARVLKENESGSLVLVNNNGSGNGDNVQITLPLAGDDSSATTITPGLEIEIIITHEAGHTGALIEISTGDDAVNMNVLSSILGTLTNVAGNSNGVLSGPAVRGTLGESRLTITPNPVAAQLNTRIVCRSITSTLWDVRAEEPASAAASLITTDAGAAFTA